jgi:AcrR family transcriptional regulator
MTEAAKTDTAMGPAATARSPSAEQLLDAAIELIAERGYAGMSVDAVCRRAGIVKSGLYWNFGSKEGLLAAVLERVGSEWIDGIQQSVYRAGGGALERLDHTLDEMQRLTREGPERLRVLLVLLLERSATDPVTRDALDKFSTSARDAVAQGIVDAIGPCMEKRDVDVVAEVWLALFEGIFIRSLIRRDEEETKRLFSGMREAVMLLVMNRIPQQASGENAELGGDGVRIASHRTEPAIDEQRSNSEDRSG